MHLQVKKHILLLTGKPGVGKTTIIQKVVSRLGKSRINGFYTEEVREHGQRLGFKLVSLSGRHNIIAHVNIDSVYRVGKYNVDVAAIDESVTMTLNPNSDIEIYLVDEIGKMECLSNRFIIAMRALMDSEKVIVATIGKQDHDYMNEVRRREDIVLWKVTYENRDELPERIINWLGHFSPEPR